MDKILQKLSENARISTADLAKIANLSPAEVEEKIAEYEKAGVIHGYTAILDDSAYGDGEVRALIEVRITPRREGGFDEVARRIAKFPEVWDLFLVSGSYDLLLTVRGNSLQEVAKFVAAKLATIDGVISTSTSFQLKKYKELGRMREDDEDHERLQVCP